MQRGPARRPTHNFAIPRRHRAFERLPPWPARCSRKAPRSSRIFRTSATMGSDSIVGRQQLLWGANHGGSCGSKGVGSLYSDDCGHGRPRGRKVDCRPSRVAVRSCHDASPNGQPRATDRRKASSSASVCGVGHADQRRGSASGPPSTRPRWSPCTRCQRLDHRQCHPLRRDFRNGFRSTYRTRPQMVVVLDGERL